ncbi:ComF family protein [Massilia litorea]|uniref:ComF family protein n=1 Tax=Massilia litorea TaxID=2769491 RepID=A0A7L9U775_9BURK|nr:ComF family protein [Massilia litorea]QOL50015.1 ComF family protein [Massilia litorea]
MGERIEPLLLRWPRALAGRLLPMLLPSSCALCGEQAPGAVCASCTLSYAAPGGPRCPCCANPLGPTELPGQACGACLADEPAHDATVVAVDYAAPLDGLVLGLKFGARLPLAPWCAGLLRDAVLARPGLPLPDLLCPVPLGPRRLRERGFNQALEIARPLASALGVGLQPRLATRAVETAAQSGVRPRERAANIRGAFEIAPDMAERIQGRHVGVVDDVMTSGHTLNELAATLKAAGALRVTNLVFARTPPH